MLNWLMNHVFDRDGYRDAQEELARFDAICAQVAGLEKRIGEVYTKEEWAALEARIKRENPYLFTMASA